jgi:hypothetical protein
MIEEDNGEYMLSSEVLPEIDRLNARIADLEAEILRKSVKEWANKDKEKIDAPEGCIAELEQWHPASAPPEFGDDHEILLLIKEVDELEWAKDYWSNRHDYNECIGWRELPPMQGKE